MRMALARTQSATAVVADDTAGPLRSGDVRPYSASHATYGSSGRTHRTAGTDGDGDGGGRRLRRRGLCPAVGVSRRSVSDRYCRSTPTAAAVDRVSVVEQMGRHEGHWVCEELNFRGMSGFILQRAMRARAARILMVR